MPHPPSHSFFSFLFTLFSWIKVSHVFDQAKPYCNSPLASLKKKIYWIWIVFIDSQDVLFSNLWTSLGVRCKDGLTKAYEKDSSTKDNNVYKRDDKESHVFVIIKHHRNVYRMYIDFNLLVKYTVHILR